MVAAALPYLPLTVALLSLSIATYAAVRSTRGSVATRERKPPAASLEKFSDELASALASEKIAHQLQKVENRLRMRDERGKYAAAQAPGPGATKAALMRHYGFTQVGPQFAQRQLEIERANKLNGTEE